MGGENFSLGGPAGGDGMWGVMALCGGCDPRVGGELATMLWPWKLKNFMHCTYFPAMKKKPLAGAYVKIHIPYF